MRGIVRVSAIAMLALAGCSQDSNLRQGAEGFNAETAVFAEAQQQPDDGSRQALADYQPGSGDAGVDEFLRGCFFWGPPGPYRYSAEPSCVYVLAAPDAWAPDFDDADEHVALLRQRMAPPGPEPNLENLPDLWSYNSFGKFVPRITVLDDGGLPYYRPASELGALWFPISLLEHVHAEHDLSRFMYEGYSDLLILSSTQGNFAQPLPVGPANLDLPGLGQWLSSGVVVRAGPALGFQWPEPDFAIEILFHELAHGLGYLPDQYLAHLEVGGVPKTVDVAMFGQMGSSMQYLTGLERAVMGWVPLLQIRYDISLCLRPAGLPDSDREFYYVGPHGGAGREFFTLENLDVFPSANAMPDRGGLAVCHNRLPAAAGQRQDTPARVWVLANGAEPWEDSGRQWLIPWGAIVEPNFPGAANGLTEAGIPSSRLWDGEDSGIRLRNIIHHDSLSPAAVPDWLMSDARIELVRAGGRSLGAITLDAEVGKHLPADYNADGFVDDGDLLTLRANLGKEIGVDIWRLPVDRNGDGRVDLVPDLDGDGLIATSERFYGTALSLGNRNDWLDQEGDAINDLDPDVDGVLNLPAVDADSDGFVDHVDLDRDGQSDTVPQFLDGNGDGVINELDAALIGYRWGEASITELWVPQQPWP